MLIVKGGIDMLKPLADRVLVKVDEEETKTKGGILIPDTATAVFTSAKSPSAAYSPRSSTSMLVSTTIHVP